MYIAMCVCVHIFMYVCMHVCTFVSVYDLSIRKWQKGLGQPHLIYASLHRILMALLPYHMHTNFRGT